MHLVICYNLHFNSLKLLKLWYRVLISTHIFPLGKTQTITGYIFGPCHVNQLDSSFAYDYEYLGPNLRVVTTPLTDRCHLAMVMAMKQFECGTVVGPTSSGKTESIKDLAEVMNKQIRLNSFFPTCNIFNK